MFGECAEGMNLEGGALVREITSLQDTNGVYESPRIVELGKVEQLTLGHDKKHGHTDGFTFHGTPIVHHS